MSITVKTQAELDAAIAAGSQGIIIDSPAGVWLSVGGAATVWASGSSSVEAWGSATVRASGSVTVRAWDSVTVRAWDSSTVQASPLVAVYLHSGRAVVHGGTLIDLTAITETDPVTWCAVHGVAVTDGVASLYKATDGDLTAGHSYRMVRYDVGTEPTAPDFDTRNKCGGGLHLSPTTSQATTYRPDASRWVRVEVPVGDIVPIPSLLSGSVAKCKVRTCRVVAEVDRDGREIAR
jgi:hypothetical protein